MKHRKQDRAQLTQFQRKVYQAVSKIPLGQIRSYKWVAKKAGRPKASQAVGQALRRNPFPLLIPCHRVVRSDGKLGGYVWGRNLKEKLLKIERYLTQKSKSGIIQREKGGKNVRRYPI